MGAKRKRAAGATTADTKPKNTKKVKSAPDSKTDNDILEIKPFAETPTGEDRRREGTLYELLASEDADERSKAADCITSSLLLEDVPSEVIERHLNRRLFRGLASGRNAARLGFSMVISNLIRNLFEPKKLADEKYPGLTFEKIIGFLTEATNPTGNIPGQEVKDHYFGQVFGLFAFVQSNVLFEPSRRWKTVLDLLLKLAKDKVWLRSLCGWTVIHALPQMDEKEAASTLSKITDAGLAHTPEGVACWIVAVDRFPDLDVKPWRHPLSTKTLGNLARVLKERPQSEGMDSLEGSKTKQANWTPQLHFVWDLILKHYLKDDTAATDFEQFWCAVMDESLFSQSASDGQKFTGFSAFQKVLSAMIDHHEKLACLFSKNFMRCLMNQAAKEDRYLHRAAMKALKAIEGLVAAHPGSLPVILEGLLGKNGAYGFDSRTNTKTVDKLFQNLDSSNAPDCLKVVRKPFTKLKQQDEATAKSVLRTYVDYMSKFLSAPNQTDSTDESMVGSPLQELAQLAYGRPSHVPEALLTDQIRELCRSRLESSFAKLVRRNDDYAVLCKAVSSIDATALTMDDEIRDSVQEATARMSKLLKRKTKTQTDKLLAQGLAMLHAVSIFQLYNEDPDALETLQDLAQFSDRLKKGQLAEDGESSVLLVEILLAMVARESSLMRQVSQQVFSAFTSQITAEGLELLTGPLTSSESTKGQKELFNTEDDAMDVDEEGSSSGGDEQETEIVDMDDVSDGEIDSALEFVDINGEDAEDDEDSDDDEEEEDDSEEDSDEEEQTEEQKKLANLDDDLGKILNSHTLDKDGEAEASDNDADMSDSEMFAMGFDDQLAEVFKQRTKSRPDTKKQKKDAKQTVVNFKHRILDLLDIYLKNEPQNQLAFTILVPLLKAMRTTSTKPLATRIGGIVGDYQKRLKKARSNKEAGPELDNDGLYALLLDVHEEAVKDDSHAFAKTASAASLSIASSICLIDEKAFGKIGRLYVKTMEECKEKGNGEKVQVSFFTEWMNWCQNMLS